MSDSSSKIRGGSGGRSAPGPMNVLVLAKAPVPGRVKTRLCPPCTPAQAAAIAEAATRDTLAAATAVRGARTVLVLDGQAGGWIPSGVRVIRQRGDGLDERIDAAFADAGTPSVLIGMDTPQVTGAMLAEAIDALRGPGVDAVLGDAYDGGWWAAGLNQTHPDAFIGVPMSTSITARAQRSRFHALGWHVAGLQRLRDVDTFADAVLVADAASHTRFARAVDAVAMSLPASAAGGGR